MGTNEKVTPIAIFTYNRPTNTRDLLNSLSQCSRVDTCPIFIFSDNFKDESQREKVQEVRTIIHNFQNKIPVTVIEASENMGLNDSIINGISKICEEYSRIIVLEDDLILNPQIIDFFIQTLNLYENEPQVSHISGFTFPINYMSNYDAYFLPFFSSWGWATWQRSWKEFEWTPDKAKMEMDRQPELRKHLFPYYDMFLFHYERNEMVWDLLWRWKIQSQNKIGLFPSTSLTWCSGFDQNATHTNAVPDGYQASYDKVMSSRLHQELVLPDQYTIDSKVMKSLWKFLKYMYPHQSLITFLRRFRYKLSTKLSGKGN
jgi:hypothetical protein